MSRPSTQPGELAMLLFSAILAVLIWSAAYAVWFK